jgi:hypothetical protein
MNHHRDIIQDKSLGDLGKEAAWFAGHTFFALIILGIVVASMATTHPDPDAGTPKLVSTALAFLVPMIGGFIIDRLHHNDIARYIWISGLVVFSIVCVWVLDLPTGPGLCETCGAVEKLWRTFFSFDHGSGLMAGDGVFAGTWIPLSMLGYAFGASMSS